MTSAVGIVVVSHSAPLARAAVDLALQMVPAPPPIEVAAGTADGGLGTDAVEVAQAIDKAAASVDSVLVLMDLGSAVLSAEMALEFTVSEAEVRLCSAPLVEGLVAATVTASTGADLAAVADAAREALIGKSDQVGDGGPPEAPTAVPLAAEISREVTLVNPHGLHLRPAAEIAQAVAGLDAHLTLRIGERSAQASSPTSVTGLGAVGGNTVTVAGSGADADAAVTKIVELIGTGFGEVSGTDDDPVATADPPPSSGDGAIGASDGIGIGPAWHLEDALVGGTDADVLDSAGDRVPSADEPAALAQAIDSAHADLTREVDQAEGERAAILRAHLVLLTDPALREVAEAAIERGTDADTAWRTAVGQSVASLRALAGDHQRARAADIETVGARVLRVLRGVRADLTPQPGVLFADDLSPSLLDALDPEVVEGVVLAGGSRTSHVAIMARAAGLPLVVGAGSLTAERGTAVAIDGSTGDVYVDPGPELVNEFLRRRADAQAAQAAALAAAAAPAVTSSGRQISVAANVGSVRDAERAVVLGADGVGLLRTELMFLDRTDPPTQDEQEASYRRIAEAMQGRRVIIRTMDIGGDKPVGYADQPAEENPFLGLRGVRLSLARPHLFSDQLQAIVRVAQDHPISVMFPMVARLQELTAARTALQEAATALGMSGLPELLEVGIMVEVPAAAINAAELAESVDFFSIGTNDLTQYVMAAERGNPHVADLTSGLQPAVRELIAQVCAAAAAHDVHVGVCGELAADPEVIPELVGLGVEELSMAPPAIARVKALVRELD